MMASDQITHLIKTEIPNGRSKLTRQSANLERLANYCEDDYFKSESKHLALERTKSLTNQALAFVAYQINHLAHNFVDLLDLQKAQLAEMESQVNHISQTVDIHQEKVARREIAVLTSNRIITQEHKIMMPRNSEKPAKYQRKPIDYTLLDDIGHGVKITNTGRLKRMSGISQLNGAANTLTLPSSSAPTTKPPTPPSSVRGARTLSRASKEYRTPAPPVAPPEVPSNYAPANVRYPQQNKDAARRGVGYSTLPHPGSHSSHGHSAYSSVGNTSTLVHPSHQVHGQTIAYGTAEVSPSPTPPLPPPPAEASSPMNDSFPDPPPMHSRNSSDDHSEKPGNASPPLPPPPMDQMYTTDRCSTQSDDWIPKEYIEKVVAIYEYTANCFDELSFTENSVIYVTKKNEDGWYEGVLNGITGLFPGNYVEPCV